jgi:hypothetical protein
MKNVFGNQPVSGENFYGREKFVRLLVGILTSGNSFLLLGLRRIGKSSTITETLRRIEENDKKVEIININCQTYRNIQDFYKHLYLALPLSWQSQLKKVLKDSKKIPTKIIDFITDHVEEVNVGEFGSLKLRNDVINYSNPLKDEITEFFKKQEKNIIIFIDELPFLFEAIDKENQDKALMEITAILTSLRDWRESGVSLAICGSLNLHLQLENLGISKKLLAGLNSQQLPKYTEMEARGLLEKLAKSYDVDLTKEHITSMLKQMPDYIPQFLQYYFSMVKTFFNDEDFDIDEIYIQHVYPSLNRDFEYQFQERLIKFNRDELEVVKKILNLIAVKNEIHESELLKSIKDENAYAITLKLLSHEFIVKDEKENYSFSLEMLKKWWLKKNL